MSSPPSPRGGPRFPGALAATCLLLLAATLVLAGPGDDPPRRSQKKQRGPKPPGAAAKRLTAKDRQEPITEQVETEVLAFVREHHAELAELLQHLKEHQPAEYRRAMQDLRRTHNRLAQVQQRDMESYVLELHRWKYQSRAQLLAARLRMTQSDELTRQLRETLTQKLDVELAILQKSRQRQADRLQKTEDQIERTVRNRDELVDRQLRTLTSGKPPKNASLKDSATRKTSVESRARSKTSQ